MEEFKGLRFTEKGMEIDGTPQENLKAYLTVLKNDFEPDLDIEKVYKEMCELMGIPKELFGKNEK